MLARLDKLPRHDARTWRLLALMYRAKARRLEKSLRLVSAAHRQLREQWDDAMSMAIEGDENVR